MKLLSLLFASAAAAELTFTAKAVKNGETVDISPENIVKMPPRSRPQGPRGSANSTGRRPPPGPRQKREEVELSPTWCGISQQYADSQDPITTVYGIFETPDLSDRTGTYPQYGAAWIGIDGWTCQQALLQAGVTTILNSNGEQSASAWFEWYPEGSYSIPYSTISVQPNDWILVNITAPSANEGTITITDLSQETGITVTLVNGPPLCRQDADWIVEDFDDSDGVVPFARFADIWFEEASATSASGHSIGLDGAEPIYMGSSVSGAMCVAEPYDNSDFVCVSQN